MSDINLDTQANEELVPMPLPGGDKKKGIGIVLAIIAVVVIILFTVGGILIYKTLRSPEARLAHGIAILAGEMEEYGASIGDKIDFDSLVERMQSDPSTVNMSFNLTLPQENTLPTLGFDVTTDYNIPEELMRGNMVLSVFNIRLLDLNLTASDDKIYISAPNLLDGNYYLNGSTLGKDYNNSVWMELLGLEVEDDYSYNIFEKAEQVEEINAADKDLLLAIAENIIKIEETMTLEKTKEFIEIERGGKTVKCDGMRVVLSKDALNNFIADVHIEFKNSAYMQNIITQVMELYGEEANIQEVEELCEELVDDFFSIRYAKDVELYIYLDKKDHIVSIATADEIHLENGNIDSIGFSFEFTGETRALDEVNGVINLKSESESFTISINRIAELTKSSYINNCILIITDHDLEEEVKLYYANEWNLDEDEFKYEITLEDEYGDTLGLVTKGSLSDIVKGESFTLNLGEFSLLVKGEAQLTVSGRITAEPFEGTITVPDGAKDLMKLSENEIFMIILELYNSFNELTGGIDF